jgi:hypothetical protein
MFTDVSGERTAPTSKLKRAAEHFSEVIPHWDHLCGLVVRVPGYRTRGPGSISGITRFLGMQRGPLSLVSTMEITAVGDPLRLLRNTPLFAKVALPSLTSGGSLVGVVHSRTKTTELLLFTCACTV